MYEIQINSNGSEKDMKPQTWGGGLKIWTPSFSDTLVPTKAETAKKSI